MSEALYPIKVAAKKSGLTVHTIRAWERRYNILAPSRTGTNRRLYSEEEIQKLSLLFKATQEGYPIGSLLDLSLESLSKMLKPKSAVTLVFPQKEITKTNENSENFISECLIAIKKLDPTSFELILNKALISLGKARLIEDVIFPLIEKIGKMWQEGNLRISHEHLASSLLRTFLGGMINNMDLSDSAPLLISTTPAGQIHELGALIVGVIASLDGWRVNYLGPNLPAEEIIEACLINNPKVLCLSFVYPGDDLRLEKELKQLKKFLPKEICLLAGGRAVNNYRELIEDLKALPISDLSHFKKILRQVSN